MAREADRIEQFDGVRPFAFLAVFSFHAVHLPFGYLGEDLFFVLILSGFLITCNVLALRDRATTASVVPDLTSDFGAQTLIPELVDTVLCTRAESPTELMASVDSAIIDGPERADGGG